jgi:hypothetical protein
MVIEELVRAVTSPPTPLGPRGGVGGGDVVLASLELRRASALTDFGECVDALATPTPLTSTVTAMAEESPTFRRTLLRIGWIMGGSPSASNGGIRDSNILANECVGAIGRA